MTYKILATGSKGNAVIINGAILVDCGVPFYKLRSFTESLKLVLLTHVHGDHFTPGTVRALARIRPGLRWACGPWLVDKLIASGVNPRQIDVYPPGAASSYDGLAAVMSEPLTHNVENCGWHIFADGESLFYATDTGTLDGVEAKGYDLYMVEANHRIADLEAKIAEKNESGAFAYEYAAAQNHLSYEQAVDWLSKNMGPKSFWIPMHTHIDKGGNNAEQDN